MEDFEAFSCLCVCSFTFCVIVSILAVDTKDFGGKGSIGIALVLRLFILIFLCSGCAVEVAEQASEQGTSFHLSKLKWLYSKVHTHTSVLLGTYCSFIWIDEQL